jgi:bifunctional UDP-N-acetylglucosamine pyrophosphorylase/glucosamine-1-phosphate N-acetyltransferase
MVLHVIHALDKLEVDRVVIVVGHGGDQVIKTVTEYAPSGLQIEFAEQAEQRGTGDAVAVALNAFSGASDDEDVIILPGDTPLLRPETLSALLASHRARGAGVTVLTAELENPSGYGRIVRAKDGRVSAVVEHRDATDEQHLIREINTSIYCVQRPLLAPALRRTGTANAQGEHYLTDVVGVLYEAGYPTDSMTVDDPVEAAGVNDRAQLAEAESVLRYRINDRWMRRGVTMWDPERTYVDVSVRLEDDVVLLPGTILKGTTTIEKGTQVGPNAHLEDTTVGRQATIGTVSADRAFVGAAAVVESFVTLHPGAVVAEGEHVEAHRSVAP